MSITKINEINKKLDTCPFCGGKARVSFRQLYFMGWYDDGLKKINYGCQVICNNCKARGGLATRVIISGGEHIIKNKNSDILAEKALRLWNRAELTEYEKEV